MDRKKTLISLITVSYNAARTIEQTILSVLGQTYTNIEYIIIDGGSTDGTLEIIKKYENNITYWVSEPDKGIYDAMNKGVAKANGDLIGIVNADDWYHRETVQLMAKAFEDTKTVGLYYGNLFWEGTNEFYRPVSKMTFLQLYRGMLVPFPTVFIPKKTYEKYMSFDASYKICADYDLVLRLYKNKVPFQYVESSFPLAYMGGEGISSRKESVLLMIQEKYVIRKQNINTFIATIIYWKEMLLFHLRAFLKRN